MVAEINETGTALVFNGFQPTANRYVAVKVLKPSIARNPEAVQRFRQEGDLLAQFHHPRLLEVYEIGEAEGLVYRAERLGDKERSTLLQILVKQFIVDQHGKIIDCELHAPFAFLRYLVEELYTLGSESRGSSQLRLGAQKNRRDLRRFLF